MSFIGATGSRAQIVEAILAGQSCLLTGRRRIGKTSTLRHMADLVAQQSVSMYIDFVRPFPHALVRANWNSVKIPTRIPVAELMMLADTTLTLERIGLPSDTRLTVFCDEPSATPDLDFLHIIRWLYSLQDDGAQIVVADHMPFSVRLRAVHSSTPFDNLIRIPILPFTFEETREFLASSPFPRGELISRLCHWTTGGVPGHLDVSVLRARSGLFPEEICRWPGETLEEAAFNWLRALDMDPTSPFPAWSQTRNLVKPLSQLVFAGDTPSGAVGIPLEQDWAFLGQHLPEAHEHLREIGLNGGISTDALEHHVIEPLMEHGFLSRGGREVHLVGLALIERACRTLRQASAPASTPTSQRLDGLRTSFSRGHAVLELIIQIEDDGGRRQESLEIRLNELTELEQCFVAVCATGAVARASFRARNAAILATAHSLFGCRPAQRLRASRDVRMEFNRIASEARRKLLLELRKARGERFSLAAQDLMDRLSSPGKNAGVFLEGLHCTTEISCPLLLDGASERVSLTTLVAAFDTWARQRTEAHQSDVFEVNGKWFVSLATSESDVWSPGVYWSEEPEQVDEEVVISALG